MANKITVNVTPKQRIGACLTTPKLGVDLNSQIKVVPPTHHSELLGLDYESSGHKGFASSQFVEEYAVPFRLASLPPTTGFRQGASIYLDDGKTGFRMSMTALKDLNTKIITTDDASSVDMSKLTVDDFIYERKK